MPASPAVERALRRLRGRIREVGGVAQVLRAEVIEGGQHLAAVFDAAREQEYGQVISGCAGLAAKVRAMTASDHFGYAELGNGRSAEAAVLTLFRSPGTGPSGRRSQVHKLGRRTTEGLVVLTPASMCGRYERGGAANGPYQA